MRKTNGTRFIVMVLKCRYLHFVILLFSVSGSSSIAAEFGLIVGVEKFAHHPELNLPGVKKDVEMMKDVFLGKGIPSDHITVLDGENATAGAVKHALQRFVLSTRPSDIVAIYISTHGSQIADLDGDELDDGYDEFLTFHDFLIQPGPVTDEPAAGFILDDELQKHLYNIPATKLFILDSCASATAHKGISTRLLASLSSVNKYIKGPWSKPKVIGNQSSAELFDLEQSNLIVLSASQDSQLAGSDSTGSFFTKALYAAISFEPRTPFCWYLNAYRLTTQSSGYSQQPGFEGGWELSNTELFEADQPKSKPASNFFKCLSADKQPEKMKLGNQQFSVIVEGYNSLQGYTVGRNDGSMVPLEIEFLSGSKHSAEFAVKGIHRDHESLILIAHQQEHEIPSQFLTQSSSWASTVAVNRQHMEMSKINIYP